MYAYASGLSTSAAARSSAAWSTGTFGRMPAHALEVDARLANQAVHRWSPVDRLGYATVDGLMMRTPLLVRGIAERAETLFAGRTVTSVRTDGSRERVTYGEVVRARPAAGVARCTSSASGPATGWRRSAGTRRATSSCTSRCPSMGAVLHTLNIRLFEDDLRYIVGHAERPGDLPRRLARRA